MKRPTVKKASVKKPAVKKPAKKKLTPFRRDANLLGLTEGRATRNRVLLYTPALKEYLRESRVSPIMIHNAIQCGVEELKLGKEVPAGKATTQKGGTGKYKGRSGALHLKITAPDRVFFGKVTSEACAARDHVTGLAAVERHLKTHGGKIAGEKFKTIKPHLVYERRVNGKTISYIVSDFYGKKQVIQLSNSPKRYSKPRKAVRKLRATMRRAVLKRTGKRDSYDIGPHNTFKDRKTGELIVFDSDRSRTFRSEKPRKRK